MRCLACGRPIYAAQFRNVITLVRYWTHYSWWANRSHTAIPDAPGALREIANREATNG